MGVFFTFQSKCIPYSVDKCDFSVEIGSTVKLCRCTKGSPENKQLIAMCLFTIYSKGERLESLG